MPRKTPTNVLELRGSFKKHPERRAARANEPEPTGPIGSPPSHLTLTQCAAWQEIVDNAHPGVFGSSDRAALEIAAVLMAEFRQLGTAGITDARISRLISLLSSFGMTPADRAKINVTCKQKRNPFADL